MSLLITALIVLICVGLVVWLMDRSPFDPMIRWVAIAVAVVVGIVVIAQRAGLG